ncbi:MAG: endonuclease, partial [Bacteroidetes bacterium]|nr:endonuclease [Bacteroidota bacterium]
NYLDQHFTRSCVQNCQPTIPVENPNRTIDFVMFTPGRNLSPVSTRVTPEKYASDHLPVVATLIVK